MESIAHSWKESTAIFLKSDSDSITYGAFFNDIEKLRAQFRKLYPEKEFFAVEAKNDYQTYLTFIALLFEKHTVFLLPSYQFYDQDYRTFMETEMQTSFIDLAHQAPLISSAKKSKSQNQLMNMHSQQAGFIVRTSGTSGKKFKYILHDPALFIQRYIKVKKQYNTTIAFFPAESIAGIETLLETIAHMGQLAVPTENTTPQYVSELIEKFQVDFFHTTPSFLNLLLMAKCFSLYQFKSLRKIAYGSEATSTMALLKIKTTNPAIEFVHKYGMSEIGVLATITNPDSPDFFKLDENVNQARIVDGKIEIKSMTHMLGYLNYENSEDTWFKTNDAVQTANEGFFKIIGRADDLINVAGKKFYPLELEELLINIEGVKDVVITSSPHDIIGTVISAHFHLAPEITEDDFRRSYKVFCEKSVPGYMRPQKVIILKDAPITPRFKKSRNL